MGGSAFVCAHCSLRSAVGVYLRSCLQLVCALPSYDLTEHTQPSAPLLRPFRYRGLVVLMAYRLTGAYGERSLPEPERFMVAGATPPLLHMMRHMQVIPGHLR